MNKGYLSSYFTGVGTKILTRVDATKKSNQHEIGDNTRSGDLFKQILGDQPRKQKHGNRFNAIYAWLHGEQESITEYGKLSWYDTRENISHRMPEWRLYYQSNTITDYMDEGDRLFVAKTPCDTVLFLVVPKDSKLLPHVFWLFGLSPDIDDGFFPEKITSENDKNIDFISRLILDEIGIEYEDPNANTLDSIIERFGNEFPPTVVFSKLARDTLSGIDARDDPDLALVEWLNHEEAMFRRLENKIVAERISQGFENDEGVDVDSFIKYSLSVQNRRKSRMGHSLEHHLKAIFDSFELNYAHQIKTEKNKKPDFVFPGKEQYFDQSFNVSLLTMLAAKSSCKDRWPQILPEAERIPLKHLVTLEPGISVPQTDMMIKSSVQLIVPSNIQDSYQETQKQWLYSIEDFVKMVDDRQKG